MDQKRLEDAVKLLTEIRNNFSIAKILPPTLKERMDKVIRGT
jgi:hypothetical protein